MHRIFGVKSKIAQKKGDRIVIHACDCCWGKRKSGWTPKTCASIQQYETGLVKGTLPLAEHYYTKKRSLDHKVCELVIAKK